jgi:hypothetical protein
MAVRAFPLRVILTLRSSGGEITGIRYQSAFSTLQECFDFVEDVCDKNYPAYVLEEVSIK